MHTVLEIALALAAVNLVVTACVIRAASLLPRQKLAQCLLIWLVPVFGAIVVSIFLYSTRDKRDMETRHIRNDEDYPGVNLYPPHGPSDP